MGRDGSQNADRLHEEAKSGCYLRASRAVQHRHVYKQGNHQSWKLGSCYDPDSKRRLVERCYTELSLRKKVIVTVYKNQKGIIGFIYLRLPISNIDYTGWNKSCVP